MVASNQKGPTARALPHIDDIKTVKVNRNLNLPLKKILEDGNHSFRMAKAYCSTFSQPDRALIEFLKAYTILVEVAPRHKDYSAMRDRKDVFNLYQTLRHNITTNHDAFMKVREEIIADNKRTGIKASVSKSPHEIDIPHQITPHTGDTKSALISNASKTMTTGSPQKRKPEIYPKPVALQGRSITKETSSDLIARFQSLRSGPLLTQDPRIKTHPPIIHPDEVLARTPQHSRSSSQAGAQTEREHQKTLSLGDVSSLNMPQLPAAIYNPARGTVSSQVANLPSSTPRGMFSRTNSIISVSSVPNSTAGTPQATSPTRGDDYFATAHSISQVDDSISMPLGDTISVVNLHGYMARGIKAVKLLLIDVRPREEFDMGHILSQNTICVEPITLKEGIGAEDVMLRMMNSSPAEQAAFQRRDKFDLVVLYDENSEIFPSANGDGNPALGFLRDALGLYSGLHELKHSPKLLSGGLMAWTDTFGPHSLKKTPVGLTSSPASYSTRPHLGPVVAPENPVTYDPTGRSIKVAPVPGREIRKWEDLLEQEELSPISKFSLIRSTEDFLRRYPDINNIQESMSSKTTPPITSMFPPVPSRPAPAVPRPSYTGFADINETFGWEQAQLGSVQARITRSTASISETRIPANLQNQGATCYADSIVQILLASGDFAAWLYSGRWMDVQVPTIPSDGLKTARHPQILTKILSGLFQHMRAPAALKVKNEPTTLRKYMGVVGEANNLTEDFGDPQQQHDAQEYLLVVLGTLQNETNPCRGNEFPRMFPAQPGESLWQYAARWHSRMLKSFNSLPDTYMRWAALSHVQCPNGCVDSELGNFRMEHSFFIVHGWGKEDEEDGWISVETIVSKNVTTVPDYRCDVCKSRPVSKKLYVSLPKYLFVIPNRTAFSGLVRSKKKTMLDFPVREQLDMTPLVWPREENMPLTPPDCDGPFHYELYGIVCHMGADLNSGHYTNFVKKEGKGWQYWWYLNDMDPSPMAQSFDDLISYDERTPRKQISQAFTKKAGDVYVLAYQRVPTVTSAPMKQAGYPR